MSFNSKISRSSLSVKCLIKYIDEFALSENINDDIPKNETTNTYQFDSDIEYSDGYIDQILDESDQYTENESSF